MDLLNPKWYCKPSAKARPAVIALAEYFDMLTPVETDTDTTPIYLKYPDSPQVRFAKAMVYLVKARSQWFYRSKGQWKD